MKKIAKKPLPNNSVSGLLADNPRLAKRVADRAGLPEIAALLLQMRQELDLTQKELAERAGVPKTTISELENAANDGVTLRTLVKIAKGASARLEIGFRHDPSCAGKVRATLVTESFDFRTQTRASVPAPAAVSLAA
jgi:transcriptional regulator with XRE-family HTH domain